MINKGNSGELTLVMADQLLQGAEGVARRDVESSIVQCTDLIMFHCVTRMDIAVPDRQRVAACGKRETKRLPCDLQGILFTNTNVSCE